MKKRSKKTFGYFFSIIVYTIIGLLCGIICGGKILTLTDSYNFLVLEVSFLLILLLGIYLHVILHEGGHLVFGLLTGYTFVSFRISSFMLIKTGDGLKLKRYSIAGTGGQCLMSPPPLNDDGTFPYALYNLGGSISNAAFSTLALLIYLAADKESFFSVFLIMFTIIGYGMALLNGIPLRMGEINNDGYNALNLGNSPLALRSLWLQLRINADMALGKRLKDINPEWFFMPDDLSDAITAGYASFVLSRELDKLNLDKAYEYGTYILENSEGLLGVHETAIKAELLYIELLGRRDGVTIDRLYNDVRKSLKASRISPSSARIMYAFELIYNGDKAAADRYLGLFEKAVCTYPNAGVIESERELLSLVDSRAEA